MHLFNFNEQNVFHYLTKSNVQNIPICFALDYNQAIGDYGDKQDDYIEGLRSTVSRSIEDDEIRRMAEDNLKRLGRIGEKQKTGE